MNKLGLTSSIAKHEGLRLKSYQDSEGVWTIGYGRNLQTMTITEQQAAQWLAEDIDTAIKEAQKFEEYAYLDTDNRRNAFIEMCYNLGLPRLSGFKKMLGAIRAQDWTTAAAEALNSKWAKQVGHRALELAERLKRG